MRGFSIIDPTHSGILVRRPQVFVDENGRYGSPLTVVEGAAWSDAECLAYAGSTGTSETVFVDEERDAEATPEQVRDYLWAWEDEAQGRMRARAFASASGYKEDEATGSAAIDLAAHLGRRLEICQGRGSVLSAEPVDGLVELRGRVTLAEVA